jgi:hypothetical protein
LAAKRGEKTIILGEQNFWRREQTGHYLFGVNFGRISKVWSDGKQKYKCGGGMYTFSHSLKKPSCKRGLESKRSSGGCG